MGDTDEDREALPLLYSPPTPTAPPGGYSTVKPDSSSPQGLDAAESRAIENDVLPETSTLGRTLSRQSAYILVISRVLGSGIFATPGTIIRAVGSVGLALSLWAVGAVVAACGLAVALEYGSMLPRSGGEKVYLEFTYRRPRFLASTVVAVMVVCLGFTASNCVVFSQYVLFAAGVGEPSEWVRKGVAVGLLTAITIIHGVFRALGVRIQNFLGWVKVGLVVFMILSGLYVVILRPRGSAPGVSTTYAVDEWDDLWRGSNWNWGVVSTSLFQVFYSYAGLENANNVLNEVKDPVRTLRFVSISALVTACVLYLLTNVAYFIVVPVEEIKASGELVAALFFERVFGGNVGGKILPLAVALSAAGNVFVVAFAMVGDSHLSIVLWCSELNEVPLVTSQAGDRPSGLPPLLRNSILNQALRISSWWSPCTLYPFIPCDNPATVQRGVFFYSQGRRLPRPGHCNSYGGWCPVASIRETGPEAPFQGMDTGRGTPHSPETGSTCGPVLPTGQEARVGPLLRNLRNCGHFGVSTSRKCRVWVSITLTNSQTRVRNCVLVPVDRSGAEMEGLRAGGEG